MGDPFLGETEGYFSANILRIHVEGFAQVLYQVGWEHATLGAADFIALLVVPNVPIVHPVYSVDFAEGVYASRTRVHRDAVHVDAISL